MKPALEVTYIGHATTLIEMEGVRLLTDPLLRRRVWHLRRRNMRMNPGWVRKIDAVLITHAHGDHLDPVSLSRVGGQVRMIAPPSVARTLIRNGFDHVTSLTVGQTTQVGSVEVEATYAEHNASFLGEGEYGDAVGYMVAGQQRVYFAGDTDIFGDMIRLSQPQIDVALLPVWGWGPTLGAGHLNPNRAAFALQLLKPRIAVPIHWGTFHPMGMGMVRPRFLIDPPYTFQRFAARLAPHVNVQVVQPGETLAVRGGTIAIEDQGKYS